MPSLPPNQQRQSTEGIRKIQCNFIKYLSITVNKCQTSVNANRFGSDQPTRHANVVHCQQFLWEIPQSQRQAGSTDIHRATEQRWEWKIRLWKRTENRQEGKRVVEWCYKSRKMFLNWKMMQFNTVHSAIHGYRDAGYRRDSLGVILVKCYHWLISASAQIRFTQDLIWSYEKIKLTTIQKQRL